MENSRRITFEILLEYFVKKRNLNDIIDRYLKIRKPKPQDKSLIYQISKGVVKRYITLDFLISRISGLKIEKIEILSLLALRIALFQIIFLDRIPDYSSVSESVSIIKGFRGRKSANFVNAVLRKATRIPDIYQFLEENIKKVRDRNRQESIRHSFPEWLVRYWGRTYSSDILKKILESLNRNPEFYFRINTLKITEKDFYDDASSFFSGPYETFLDGTAFKIKDKFEEFINSKFIREGLLFVQNLSSQIAIRYFLNPGPGEKVLDICSAPGGKSVSSALMMKNEGEIIAIESNEKRLKILEGNVKRMGADIIRSINADAGKEYFLQTDKRGNNYKKQKDQSNDYNEYFDKIFIDLPCSSFGTVSKNPDTKYNKDIDRLKIFKENSLKILHNAAPYLKRGGKITLYTCTLSKIENEELINEFMDKNEGRYKVDNTDSIRRLVNENVRDFPEINCLPESGNIIEILPWYLNSEGASICSLIKLK